MEQTNAFELLGATPSDSIETLQELFENKILLEDNLTEIRIAYEELTTPRKRIKHEILFFCANNFSAFLSICCDSSLSFSSDLAKNANIIIRLGQWFDIDKNNLLFKINDERLKINFPLIKDFSIIAETLIEIKNRCLNEIKSRLDSLNIETIIKIFNEIVQNDNYKSFFIDELIIFYEFKLKPALLDKETDIIQCLAKISIDCENYLRGFYLPADFTHKTELLTQKILEWNRIENPLRTNYYIRGCNDETGEFLIKKLFDNIIDTVGKVLTKFLNNKADFEYLIAQKSLLDNTQKREISDIIQIVSRYINILNTIESILYETDDFYLKFIGLKKNLNEAKTDILLLWKNILQNNEEKIKQQAIFENQRIESHLSWQEQKQKVEKEKEAHRIQQEHIKARDIAHKEWREQYSRAQAERLNYESLKKQNSSHSAHSEQPEKHTSRGKLRNYYTKEQKGKRKKKIIRISIWFLILTIILIFIIIH